MSGPLVDATAREMAGHAVVERVAEQLLRAGVADRLAHKRTVGQVIESRLLDHVVPVRDVHASPVTTGHNRCERCQPGAIPSVAPGPPSATPGDKTTAREIRSRRRAPRTVGDWSTVWLRDYARSAPATRRTYAYAAKQIVADIGDVVLARIDRPTARRLARQWPANTARVARTMFGDAARDGLIASNPFTELRLETPKGRKDLDALTEPEIRDLAEAAVAALGEYGTEFRALIMFLGYVGCRPGEACCIRRADVDVERADCTIRFTVDGEGGEKPPKNGKARVVTIPPPPLAALADVPPRLDSPYLFHSARGRRLSKGSLSYAFRVVRQRWGKRDKLELYELRHACATLLMERGLPPHVVANQLGHTDGGALVQRLYGHPSERGMRDQVRLAFAGWGADGEQRRDESPGNRRLSQPL